MYPIFYKDLLKAFDSEVSRLEFIPERDWLISASKSKSIKIWEMPKQWRDAKLIADQKKEAGKFLNEYSKTKLASTMKKAEEDSDQDDLAGWHLD